MEIGEVKDILGLCHALRAPKHIIIVQEPIFEDTEGGRQFFRGLQPTSRGDVIVLSAQADVTTVPHESFHAGSGLGELLAYPLGSLMAAKYTVMSRFPRLKQLRSRNIDYEEVPNPPEFPGLSKYGDRVKHYQLVV